MPSPDDDHRTGRFDAAEADLAAVEIALERLDEGTYATCERCGESIDQARLNEYPTSRTCQRCEGRPSEQPE